MAAPKSSSTASPSDDRVFRSKDKNGATWEFNPATGKWAVELGEFKTSSANPETLDQKLATHLRKRFVGREEGTVREVDMLTWPQGVRGPSVVRVKLAWDAQLQAVRVQKYRQEGPREGWKEHGKDSVGLLDPMGLEPEAAEALSRRVAVTAMEAHVKHAGAAMAQALAQHLEGSEIQGRLAVANDDTTRWLEPGQAVDRTHRALPLPQGCPVVSGNADTLLEGWEVDAQGRWCLEHARVFLDANGYANFRVQLRTPGEEGDEAWVEVASRRDWREALALGRATQELVAGGDGIACWQAEGPKWFQSSQPSWPVATVVMGATLVPQRTSGLRMRDEVDVLTCRLKTFHGGEQKWAWAWEGKRLGTNMANDMYWRRGPVDHLALNLRRGLGEALMAAQVALEGQATIRGEEPEVARKLAGEHRAGALARAWAAAEDGQEWPDGEAMKARYARLEARWKTEAGKRPEVGEFEERVREVVDAFTHALGGTKPGTRRGPKA